MRWDAFYDTERRPRKPRRPDHGGFYPGARPRPPPQRDALPRQPTSASARTSGYTKNHHYDTTVSETRITSYLGIMTGQVPRQAVLRDVAHLPRRTATGTGRRCSRSARTAPTWGSTSSRAPTPTAACTSCPAGAAACSRSSCPTCSCPSRAGRRAAGASTTRCTSVPSVSTACIEAGYGYWGFSPSSNPAGGYREYGVDVLGLNPDGYFSDQENDRLQAAYDGCRRLPGTNPNPTYGDGVVTPHAAFLAMMHEPDQAFTTSRRSRTSSRPTAGRLLRRRRRQSGTDRRALPVARPGHGHGRDRQRPGGQRAPSRLQHRATSSGHCGRSSAWKSSAQASPDLRTRRVPQAPPEARGARRRSGPDQATPARPQPSTERTPCSRSGRPAPRESSTATSTGTAGWTRSRTRACPSRSGSTTCSAGSRWRRRSA